MGKKVVIILANASHLPKIEEEDIVICADSGYMSALENGIKVDMLIGDLDSIGQKHISYARSAGVEIRSFPRDKDSTDGNLAVDAAIELEAEEILLVGGRSGRLDHVLSSLLIPFNNDCKARFEIWLEKDRFIPLCKSEIFRSTAICRTLSIVPLSMDCRVTTRGLRWELQSESLPLGSTRGIHNIPTGGNFEIKCIEGSLLVFLSDEE
ncbi:MAG: thiamine diphosphokinase [Candidatus Thermoplasmatota archaeon]|nr:thiamine diphosphokinase [Candidatus Thermoplasmatota archaeon]